MAHDPSLLIPSGAQHTNLLQQSNTFTLEIPKPVESNEPSVQTNEVDKQEEAMMVVFGPLLSGIKKKKKKKDGNVMGTAGELAGQMTARVGSE